MFSKRSEANSTRIPNTFVYSIIRNSLELFAKKLVDKCQIFVCSKFNEYLTRSFLVPCKRTLEAYFLNFSLILFGNSEYIEIRESDVTATIDKGSYSKLDVSFFAPAK